MPTITICEGQKTDDGFKATVSVDRQTRREIAVQDPFDEKREQALEFYFEEWIRFPQDRYVEAKRAEESIREYGEALFEQVFRRNADAYSDYQRACRGGLTNLRIEIAGESPEFQALHWEAMRSPGQMPLAVECVFTRKRFQQVPIEIELKASPVINLLVVTARPDEEDDAGYRTISRPLMEAIQQGQLRVNVELLRPGTFQALSEHLEGKAGFYHIIHFDVHGGLMTYEQFKTGVKQDRYVLDGRFGRGEMAAYDGLKAFLFLEGKRKGEADPVAAEELAALLTNKGVPICILNACQSGKQARAELPGEEARETSLGSRLMAAGVQMVVAMGYSVTVSAAALMMTKLYGELVAQKGAEKGIPEAIRLGRKALYNQKERRVYFDQRVPLEDWLLPVVYANREVDMRLQALSGREKAEFLTKQGQRYWFERPTYGFVGRDLEILKIEKALLRHNVLLLRGMGGTGKTTLLNYLREWWQTTSFAKDVFYFGYDETAHTLQQILRVIGKRLYEDVYEFAAFEAMPLAAQMEDVVDGLRGEPYVLMLDNLESVTGQALAIQNTLPEAEQGAIRDFLRRLSEGKTKVVLGSRSEEAWLAKAFTAEGSVKNVYTLGGLDPESRSVLAEKILAAQVKVPERIAALRAEDGFKRLMGLLAGYPLAMEVVLANLARQSPEEILAGLSAADVDLDVGGEDKTKSILKCVEYSHSNLSPDAQKLLVCLAPFNSFIDRADLENYGKQLKQLAPFADYDFERFDDAVQEAIRWGLLSPMSAESDRLLTIQPIFPYFLRTKLSELDIVIRDALYEGFKNHYKGLAESYDKWMDSKEPQEKQLGVSFCRLEYENLYAALKISLARKENISTRQISCFTNYFDLTGNKGSANK